jgi:hypothetical protein
MKFRTGAVVGFAVGYYYGAKAGRERYHQLQGYLERVQDNPNYRQARERALEVADKGASKARQVVEERLPGGSSADTTIDLDAQDHDTGIAVP